jgi:hypothetical protein
MCVPADAGRRKHELPSPLLRSVRKLSFEGVGQNNTAETRSQVPLVYAVHPRQVHLKTFANRVGQHRPPVLLSLPAPHRDFAPIEIDVLHPQVETLLQSQTGPVQECKDY